jgi:4-hydroxybenzoate polyprenyltransferase
MNGFITESVSKLSDGIGNSIRLLLLYLITTLIYIPANTFFHRIGTLIYILILLALAVIELQRSLAVRTSDSRRAWNGMASGVYFWQVIRFTTDLTGIKLFQQAGIIFW